MSTNTYEITKDQWERIKDMLPKERTIKTGRPCGTPIFTSGEIHDSNEAVSLLENFDITGSAVMGNKAFGTVEILAYIRNNGGEVVIPPKSNTKDPWDCDYSRYK